MAMTERDILKTELRWGAVVAGAVGIIIAVIVGSSLTMALHPPSNVETIDPATIHLKGEFVESNLGTRIGPDGSVVARMVAAQFSFVPRCLAVPADRPVSIRITSPDVIHGFIVAGTNVNTMVVPGYVSEVKTVFQEPGDHLMPCHEYCGLGHSEMWSVVRVIPQAEWHPDEHGRVGCEIPG
jgi:cytochrome c oxidase subunit II